jgi:predicted alpha/beta hydrolase family esterase
MSDYCTTLIVPGLHGSNEDHWQSWWQEQDRSALRVVQDNWSEPDLGAWAGKVGQAVDESRRGVWIVAHSFGCLASLHAAQHRTEHIKGIFLVAPADPEKFGVSARLPVTLDVPTIFIASSNDPWLNYGKAKQWADTLGSRFVALGDAGHINPESGFGAWQTGFDLFETFKREVSAARICASLI